MRFLLFFLGLALAPLTSSLAQGFSQKIILLSNTEASKQSDVIVPAKFGANKNYFVKHLDGLIKVFQIEDNQEVEINTITGFGRLNLVDFLDFDQDGDIDILTDFGPIYNLGDENFGGITFPSGSSLLGRVKRYVDFNKDGNLDIISVSNGFSGTLKIYLLNANQQIFDVITLEDEDSYDVIRIADFNKDGDNDIIYIADHFGGDRLVYLENQGDNTFSSEEISGFSRSERTMMLIDLDSDEDLDIINPGSSDLDWVENQNNELSSFKELNGNTDVLAMNVADFNNDGNQDIVVLDDTDWENYKVLVFINNGDGTLQQPIQLGEISGISPLSVLVHSAFENWINVYDYNEDGLVDILINEFVEEQYVLFTNQLILSNKTFDTLPISIYPNPTDRYLNFEIDKNADILVEIYSVTGQLIIQQKNIFANNRLDLSHLMSGNYVLRIIENSSGKTYFQKIVKK